MFTITLDPIIAHLGPFVLRWYSLILMVAIGVGVWLTAREAERRGMKKDDVYEVSIYIILGGILGARIFHVVGSSRVDLQACKLEYSIVSPK